MQSNRLRRREFMTLLGGTAAVWPLQTRAQQTMPVIGFLDPRSPELLADRLREFRRGLKETGYVEGENVSIVYRGAENDFDRLSALAAVVQRPVAVIIASGGPGVAVAAKVASTTTPIVFGVGEDPVRLGLVASLARPGGNLTGVNFLNVELTRKRLELLRELVPGAARVAVLVNPANPAAAQGTLRDLETAARGIGIEVQISNARTSREIDAVFAAAARERIDALLVGQEPFFSARRMQLANTAARHMLPMISAARDITEAGGLMSYGTNILDVYRRLGLYTGRILKGAKPVDLPVEQSAKFELLINAQTARMLGISVPQTLLVAADEVIE
jgi:putative ABC transport system substrate-binding protein